VFGRLAARTFLVILAVSLTGAQANKGGTPTTNGGLMLRSIAFANTDLLSPAEKAELRKMIEEDYKRTGTDAGAMADVGAERLRMAYLNKGYFKVVVTSAAWQVGENAPTHLFDVVLTVVSSGKQYRLLGIRFHGMHLFTEEQLAELIPVRAGEIFRRSEIAKGIDEIRRHYDSYGYANLTVVPETDVDEASGTIIVNFDLDEGRQFHWGELHVTGLDPGLAQTMLDSWEAVRGRPYVANDLPVFFSAFFHPLDARIGLDNYSVRHMNEHTGTVDVSIDFVDPSSKDSQ
jgi:outer membrane translocation and assembly module TamA